MKTTSRKPSSRLVRSLTRLALLTVLPASADFVEHTHVMPTDDYMPFDYYFQLPRFGAMSSVPAGSILDQVSLTTTYRATEHRWVTLAGYSGDSAQVNARNSGYALFADVVTLEHIGPMELVEPEWTPLVLGPDRDEEFHMDHYSSNTFLDETSDWLGSGMRDVVWGFHVGPDFDRVDGYPGWIVTGVFGAPLNPESRTDATFTLRYDFHVPASAPEVPEPATWASVGALALGIAGRVARRRAGTR